MEFKEIKYLDVVLPEAPQELLIKDDGTARYISYTNARTIDQPDIGTYHAALSPEAMTWLGSLLSKVPVDRLPDHSGLAIPSGIEAKTLHVVTVDRKIIKTVSRADPIDPRLQQIFDNLDGLVKQIREHPQQVLRLETTAVSSQSDGAMEVRIAMTNQGSETLWFRNPVKILQEGNGELTIECWPVKPEPGSMWSEQKEFITPLTAEFDGEKIAPAGFDPLAQAYELLPGKSMKFKLTGEFIGKGNIYVGRVVYGNPVKAFDDKELMTGNIYSSTVNFEHPVSGKVRP